jgi:hypothetical protein
MKTIKSSLFLLIMTLVSSIALSGCYTQLAYVADDPDSTVQSTSPAFDIDPIVVIVNPIIITPPPPVFDPPPIAGSSSVTTETPSHSTVRESGYQRSSSSQNDQTVSSNSGTRTSGVRRSGR